jgi:hypothetical protein
MTNADADRLKTRLTSLPPEERNRIESILRARATELQAHRISRLIAELTPAQRRQHMSDIAAELRRRIETGRITDPRMLEEGRAMADNFERRLARYR